MARPRHTTATTQADTSGIDGAAIREALERGARLAAAWTTKQSERERARMVFQRIVRREMRELTAKMSQVADLMEAQQIKASRGYRGYQHLAEDGRVIEVRTWEQYCLLIEGRSVDAVDLDLANLRQFGVELYAALTQKGIGAATLRQWRVIPDDSHAALHAAAATGDREHLIELAEELLTRAGQPRRQSRRPLPAPACGKTTRSRATI